MTAQNIYLEPLDWQSKLLEKKPPYEMSYEEWYHIVMFELQGPDQFWENHHYVPFGSEEHKNYMLNTYGVLSFTQHPDHAPKIFAKIRETMSDPEWKKQYSETRRTMYDERYDSDYFDSIERQCLESEEKRLYEFHLSKEEISKIRKQSSTKMWENLQADKEKLLNRNNKISKQQSITSKSEEYVNRNTYTCDLCGSEILKLGNLRQHRNGKKCKSKQREFQTLN